jgi:hypothetical protein
MIATSYMLLLTAHDGSVAPTAFKARRLSKPSFLGTPTLPGGVSNLLC